MNINPLLSVGAASAWAEKMKSIKVIFWQPRPAMKDQEPELSDEVCLCAAQGRGAAACCASLVAVVQP